MLHITQEQMPARYGHVPSLDGLRALSVVLVLLSHFVSARIFPGSLGVYVFFVISGFLITRLLLAEEKHTGVISLRKFYIRRAIRLYPVVIAYTLCVVSVYILSRRDIDWKQPLGSLFYFANYVYAPMPRERWQDTMPFEPLWSLSVEEHFYFILPALIILLNKAPRKILITMVIVCVSCLIYRIILSNINYDLIYTNYFYMRTESRIDSLAYGVGMAALCEFDRGRKILARIASYRGMAIGALILIFTLIYRDEIFRETFRYSLQGVAIFMCVSGVLFSKTFFAYFLNISPIKFIGRLSYSLYVWSIGVPPLIALLLPGRGALQIFLSLGLAFGLASLSYFCLEKPVMRLRHRFSPAGGASGLAGAGGEKPSLVRIVGAEK